MEILKIHRVSRDELEDKIEEEYSLTQLDNNAIDEMDYKPDCPFRLWNREIEKLTAVNK